MTLAQLRTYMRRLLAEQTAADSFWSDADCNDFLNRGYEDVVVTGELLVCTSKASSIAAAAATMPEDGTYLQPKDTLRVQRAFFYNPSTSEWNELLPYTIADLDALDSQWFIRIASSGAIPTKWAIRGQLIHLVPAPVAVGTNNILLWCIQSPTPLSADGDEPAISQGYHEAIAIAGAIRALEADRANPDNRAFIGVLKQDLGRMIGNARSQQMRKGQVHRLRDARDAYTYTSGWRE